MTVSSVATGYDGISLLAGNTSYDPAATFLIQRISPAGGTASVTFSSIPQTYKSLQIRYLAKDSYSASADYVNFPISVNTNNTWRTHYITGDGSSAAASSLALARVFYVPNSASALANIYGTGIIDLIDYASSTKNKTFRTLSGYDRNAAGGGIALQSMGRFDTSAITDITLTADSTWAAGTTFALYGMVG